MTTEIQLHSDQTENVPVLYYPPIRGAVQPVRHLFLYLGKPYKEEAVILEKQIKPFFNSGYPMLQHNDIILTEPVCICKYICKAYERSDLLGLTPQNRAVINEFLFSYDETKREMIAKISAGAFQIWNNQGNLSGIKLNTLKTIVENSCPILLKTMKMFMKSKRWLLGYATIMDFFFYELCFYLCNFLGSVIINHPIYRNFNEFKKFFEKEVLVSQKSPQKKIFAQFKNQEALEVMKSAWQGEKTILT